MIRVPPTKWETGYLAGHRETAMLVWRWATERGHLAWAEKVLDGYDWRGIPEPPALRGEDPYALGWEYGRATLLARLPDPHSLECGKWVMSR